MKKYLEKNTFCSLKKSIYSKGRLYKYGSKIRVFLLTYEDFVLLFLRLILKLEIKITQNIYELFLYLISQILGQVKFIYYWQNL